MDITVIDDDPSALAVTKAMLCAMGHEVRDFADAHEALRDVSETRPDLVISDINMPGPDGFEVAERIAESMGDSHPRVLLVSGDAMEDARLSAFDPSLVVGVLQKPFDRRTLSGVLFLIERSRSRCPGTLAPLCLYAPSDGDSCPTRECSPMCGSAGYAQCPHFKEHCGKMLRLWIATQDSTPPAGLGASPEGGSREAASNPMPGHLLRPTFQPFADL